PKRSIARRRPWSWLESASKRSACSRSSASSSSSRSCWSTESSMRGVLMMSLPDLEVALQVLGELLLHLAARVKETTHDGALRDVQDRRHLLVAEPLDL